MAGRDVGRTVRGFFNIEDGRAGHKKLRRRILSGAAVDGIHMCQLMAAMLIASIGLNLDSTEAVIGAMLICPLMGSVLAIAYGTATIDLRLLRESAAGLAIQVAACLATSTVYFVVSPLSNQTSELLTNSSATIWDVVIALVGGFAGALGTSRKQEPTTLVAGVAVATALMPPLCAVGYGLSMRDLPFALAALYEFAINVVFIAFGAEAVFVLLRAPIQYDQNGDGVVTEEEARATERRTHVLRHRLVICSIVFALPCLFFSARLVQYQMAEDGTIFEVADVYDTEMVTRELAVVAPGVSAYRVGVTDSYDAEADALVQRVIATVESESPLAATTRAEVEGLIRLHVPDVDTIVFDDGGAPDGATSGPGLVEGAVSA